jgi:methylmalonyl-CoA/ethylmalonyl-CoA epimerase
MSKYPTSNVNIQTAFVVRDLDEAMENRTKHFGIGPFFEARHNDAFTKMLYRGEPSRLDIRMAITYVNGIQFELIQPMSTEPNCYNDVYAKGEEGFHHMCCWSHDLEGDIAYYAGLGCDAVNIGELGGTTKFAYIDTRPLLGCMMELMQYDAGLSAYFEFIHTEVKNWDGITDPVRPFPSL